MTAQCMLSDTIVTERYQQIFDTTLAFCAAVQNSDNQSIDVEEVFEEAFEQEKIFSRNVHLFTLLLQKNDNASKIHHPAKTERPIRSINSCLELTTPSLINYNYKRSFYRNAVFSSPVLTAKRSLA